MKFRFCGERDCPDWILVEIATLSKITSVKMKMLCSEVVNCIFEHNLNLQKIKRLTLDAKYDIGDIKASVAAITFIYANAVRHGIDEESLVNELQQLGLPRESTMALCRVLYEKYKLLAEHFKKITLHFSEFQDIHWQREYILCSKSLFEVKDYSVSLTLKVKHHGSKEACVHCISLSSSKAQFLLQDLKQAYATMEELSSS